MGACAGPYVRPRESLVGAGKTESRCGKAAAPCSVPREAVLKWSPESLVLGRVTCLAEMWLRVCGGAGEDVWGVLLGVVAQKGEHGCAKHGGAS